ncbi:MAG: hypothetical protein RIQ53_1356 [Pseudomonadota bacterium]
MSGRRPPPMPLPSTPPPPPPPPPAHRGPWAALRHELRLAGVALQFLTRVPVRFAHFEPQWLQDCARHFPLIGAGIGAVSALVLLAAAALWSPTVAALAALAASVWLTGGFHEDGLADTCDGLGGAVSRERALTIMKDSRLGSYGALGLGLTLAAKVALLALLCARAPALAALALVVAHTVSRAATVSLLAVLPYGGDPDHAKAKPLAQSIRRAGLVVAWGWCAVLGGGLLLAQGVIDGMAGPLGGPVLQAGAAAADPAVAVAWLWPSALRWAAVLAAVLWVAALCARWLRRRLGGYTGDGLGATQQWTELAVYAVLAAA